MQDATPLPRCIWESAVGQTRTSADVCGTTASPPIADMPARLVMSQKCQKETQSQSSEGYAIA